MLVGDFLLGQAFRMMVEVGSLRALDICPRPHGDRRGRGDALTAAKNTETSEDEYLAVIRGKTAELFAAACEVGPVLAGRRKPSSGLPRLRHESRHRLQLIDDVLDYGGTSAALGARTSATIFREGKITLPIVLHARRATDEERVFWRRHPGTRGAGGRRPRKAALMILRRHRTLEDTMDRARHYGDAARASLDIFADGPVKAALLQAVDFCIARAH